MKKVLLLLFIFVNLAFGANYDEVLLKAQASIFPKIILLDKKIEHKLIDGKIIYTIVYDADDHLMAKTIKEFINNKFSGHLGAYKYEVNLVEAEDFSLKTPATAVYVLNLHDHIEDVAHVSNVKGIISFSYDLQNLKKGLMFSLVIEKSTMLYLTKENLYTKKIEFVDALLQMVHFVQKTDYAYKNKKLYNEVLNSKIFYASVK